MHHNVSKLNFIIISLQVFSMFYYRPFVEASFMALLRVFKMALKINNSMEKVAGWKALTFQHKNHDHFNYFKTRLCDRVLHRTYCEG